MNEDEKKDLTNLPEMSRFNRQNSLRAAQNNEISQNIESNQNPNSYNPNSYEFNHPKIQRKTMLQYMVRRNNDLKSFIKPHLQENLPKYDDLHPKSKDNSSFTDREQDTNEFISSADEYSDENNTKSGYLQSKFMNCLHESIPQNEQKPDSNDLNFYHNNREVSSKNFHEEDNFDLDYINPMDEYLEQNEDNNRFNTESHPTKSVPNQEYLEDLLSTRPASRNIDFSSQTDLPPQPPRTMIPPQKPRTIIPPQPPRTTIPPQPPRTIQSVFKYNSKFSPKSKSFQQNYHENEFSQGYFSNEQNFNNLNNEFESEYNPNPDYREIFGEEEINSYGHQEFNHKWDQKNEFVSGNSHGIASDMENQSPNSLTRSNINSIIEEHGYEMIQDLRSIRDKAKNDVLKEMLDGEWHDEKDLLRIAKKSRYVGTVSFGMMMYSLKDSIYHDFLMKKIMHDGKYYYKIHDNFVGLARAAFLNYK